MKLSKGHAKELMAQVAKKYKVETFSDIHYRVEGKIDIYPTTDTYVIKATNKSGKYKDLYMFLKERLNSKKPVLSGIDKIISNYLKRANEVCFNQGLDGKYVIEIAKMIQTEEQNQASNALAECTMNRI